MTDKEVMQIALETAEQIACADYRHWEELASLSEFERWARSRANHIAEALRARLAQPEPEPVAWMYSITGTLFDTCPPDADDGEFLPLYTAPPKREWVGLTDEEVKILTTQNRTDFSRPPYEEFYRAIEAKLKEKNS